MIPLLRYLAVDVLRGQRWLAPMLCYLALLMVIAPSHGPALPTYAMSASALLPIALWITVVVFGSEEPVQAVITVVVVGSPARVRAAKVGTALLGCALLGLVAVGWISLATTRGLTPAMLGTGLLAHALTAGTGVAFGSLIARPVQRKMAWTVLLGAAITMAQLLIPYAPPVNALLKLYSEPEPGAGTALLLVAAGTAVLAVLALVASNAVARQRT